MIVGKDIDKPLEPQTKYGTTGTGLRVLVGKDEGAEVFTMRLITIEKGGQIGMHDHPWEHEIFVVKGKGRSITEERSENVEPGMWVWIPPNEIHGFENTGDETLEFICCIPNQKSS